MIILVNPRATRPGNRRFPLSVMAVGAALAPDVSWDIVDGNRPGIDVIAEVAARVDARRGGRDPVQALAFTVMPGPQLVSAVTLARRLKALYPDIPIVWGGNFPSLYPQPVLDARRTAVAGILQATSLPFIVAASAIGLELGLIDAAESAALIGAGLLSVLVFPVLGLALLRVTPARMQALPENS